MENSISGASIYFLAEECAPKEGNLHVEILPPLKLKFTLSLLASPDSTSRGNLNQFSKKITTKAWQIIRGIPPFLKRQCQNLIVIRSANKLITNSEPKHPNSRTSCSFGEQQPHVLSKLSLIFIKRLKLSKKANTETKVHLILSLQVRTELRRVNKYETKC